MSGDGVHAPRPDGFLLTDIERTLLFAIRDDPHRTLGEMSAASGCSISTVYKSVRVLAAAGLIAHERYRKSGRTPL